MQGQPSAVVLRHDVGTALEECGRRLGVARCCSSVQRRLAVLILGIGRRLGLKEQLHCCRKLGRVLGVPLRLAPVRSQVERRPTRLVARTGEVRVLLEEAGELVRPATCCGKKQGRGLGTVRESRVGTTLLHQHLQHLGASAMHHCLVQRRLSVLVRRIGVGPRKQEFQYQLRMALCASHLERVSLLGVLRIDVAASCDQVLHQPQVPTEHCEVDRCVAILVERGAQGFAHLPRACSDHVQHSICLATDAKHGELLAHAALIEL
mmetsp:Transcript_59896/g.128515  ORF Transcript_59896/g.128515 Transcript_59896/m.128515 type:complete len:264 (-) Transcript_59896:95-886(-)